jgi:hypothetical protein
MNDLENTPAEVTDSWTAPSGGASSHVWLWLKEPPSRWWSVLATIHAVFGLTSMRVREMVSREWALSMVQAQGQGDEEDTWASCLLWTPEPVDDAISAIRDAYAAARTVEWSRAYAPNFQKEVEEPFNQLRALLHDPTLQEAQ